MTITKTNNLTIETQRTRGGYQGFTTKFVTGPRKDVDSFVTAYLDKWHPMGYSTTVSDVEENGDTVTKRIWHSNTCG